LHAAKGYRIPRPSKLPGLHFCNLLRLNNLQSTGDLFSININRSFTWRWAALKEEEFLLQKFGQDYSQYKKMYDGDLYLEFSESRTQVYS